MGRMRNTHMTTGPFPNVNTGENAVTPSELNDVYSHGQFWVPAGAMTPTEGSAWSLTTYTSSGAGSFPHTWTVAEMPDGATKSEGIFTWAFKSDFVKVGIANINMRIAPIWFAKSIASAPADKVLFQTGAVNLNIGTSINFPENVETSILASVLPTAFAVNGGISSNKQAVPLTTWNTDAIGSIGDDLSAGNWNFVSLNVERESDDDLDTFEASVFLFGVGVQWEVDFNNVGAWPQS